MRKFNSIGSALKAVFGTVAHGGTDADAPVKVGLKARTTNPTALADGKVADLFGDKLGKAVVVLGAPRELLVKQFTVITASTAETTILDAGAAGVLHDVVEIKINNTSTSDARVDIRDSTGGAVVDTFFVSSKNLGGIVRCYPMPQASSANAWTAQSSVSVTDLRITVVALKNL